MRYMLIIAGDESRYDGYSDEDRAAQLQRWTDYSRALADAGAYVSGEGLQTSTTATTLRKQGGERLLTDGPFAETKEQIGGFYVVDCQTIDEAIDWAARMPTFEGSACEVRPVMDYPAGMEPEWRSADTGRKYVLLLWTDPSAWADAPPSDPQQEMERWVRYDADATAAGVMLGGEGLDLTAQPKTVRVRADQRFVTDGPFAETKEQIGGFYLLTCKDLDEAIEWAARVPVPDGAPVEIRPVMDYEGRYSDPQAAREGATS